MDDHLAELQAKVAAAEERASFAIVMCRDAQEMASCYGWALKTIADMDPLKQRADDLGRAARIARDALLGADDRPTAPGVATRHPRCGYPYCACVGECFAASQPGVTAGVTPPTEGQPK